LVWDGRDPQVAQLMDIPNHVQLAEGMQVQTSGFSAMFPAGINIGKVRYFEVMDGDNFYSIDVDLLTDMHNVSVVYVVDNLMRMEQVELEQQAQTDDD
jgi:rod shape-determining protein MreC